MTTKKDARSIQEAANHMASALETLGFDLTDENFNGTPERFVKYLLEYLQPFEAEKILRLGFNSTHVVAGYKGMVVQSAIPFRTICPHHLLPVVGKCHIGYIPTDRLVGLSKLTRIVKCVGQEMPRMQETCTDLLADILEEQLKAKGVIVVISANHNCMQGRGVLADNTPTTTSSIRGLFRDVQACRDEFFKLVAQSHL